MLLTADISPKKLKSLSLAEKAALCEEIRGLLISVVSKNGGHLASNLGTVELIVAMHSVFTTPDDKFIFDVGHQAYTHKILTGRLSGFYKLRQEGGVSGFPRPGESEHDAFIGGHSSISISAGLGIAAANAVRGGKGSVVVVAGDGSFTGGGIYEGLNNAGRRAGAGNISKNLIVVLNDNGMCISKSSGALTAYLSQIRSTKGYYEAKNRVKSVLSKSALGKGVSGAISGTKRTVKRTLIPDNLFENLGFKYFGALDGHNLEELINIFELVKTIDHPCLIHVKTKKGKGYHPAEQNSGHYHGLDKPKQMERTAPAYSDVFGSEITRLGERDDRICLITAAMKHATGCNHFAKRFPERFFDAGIAESHAATFAAGLSSQGMLPVFAVYSTFLQRSFDQLIHDAAIEKLRLVLAVDRAGLCGEDGPTHQGTFDVGLLSLIPETTIYAPLTASELRLCLKKALHEHTGITAVRYPRGVAYSPKNEQNYADFTLTKSENSNGILIITYGRIARTAVRLLNHGADLLRLVKLTPLPDEIFDVIRGYERVVFFEEGALVGGVAERISARLVGSGTDYKMRGVEGFVPAADLERQMRLCGLDFDSMREFAGL